MNENNEKNLLSNSYRKRSRSYWLLVFTVVLGIMVIIMLVCSERIRERQKNNVVVLDTIGHIQLHTSLFHLWLEEYIAGDRSKGQSTIWKNIDDALGHTSLLQYGGMTHHGEINGTLNDPALREQIVSIHNKILVLREIGSKWFANLEESGVGTLRDKEFDDTFEKIMDESARLETFFYEREVGYLKSTHNLMFALVVIWAVALVLSIVGLICLERRRRRAEENTKESEARYRELFEQASDYALVMEPSRDGLPVIVEANKAAFEKHGYSRDEMIGEPISLILSKKSQEKICDRLDVLRSTGTMNYELEHVRKDGSSFTADISCKIVKVSGMERIYSIERDISDRKRTDSEYKSLLESMVGSSGATFFDRTVKSLVELLDADCVLISELLDENTLKAAAMLEDGERIEDFSCALPGTLCNHVINDGYYECSEDLIELHPDDTYLVDMKAKSYVGTAIKDDNGKAIGVLCVISRRKMVVTERIRSILEIIAAKASSVIRRTHTEAALKESEQNYKGLFDNMLNGFAFHKIIVDNEGKPVDYTFLDVNEAFESFTGVTREKVVGRNVCKVLPEFCNPMHPLMAQYGKVALEGGEYRTEQYIEPLKRWYSILAYSNKKGYFAVVFEDITDRKNMFEQIQRSAAITEEMGDALIVLNMEREITRFNEAALKLLGYAPEEVSGLTLNDIIPERERKLQEESIQRVITEDAVVTIESILVAKDGREIPTMLTGTTSKCPDGTPTGLVGLFRDIREQKKTEALALRLGRILDGSSNEIYTFDAESLNYIMVNDGARKNIGYSIEELKKLTPVDIKPKLSSDQFAKILAPLRSGKLEYIIFKTEHERKDGTIYPIEVRLQLSSNETPPIFVAIVQDITDRKRSEEAIRIERDKLENIVEGIGAGLTLLDKNLSITWANSTIKEWFGHTDINDCNHCGEFYGIIDGQECSSMRSLKSGKAETSEASISCDNGNRRHFQIVSAPIIDSSGEINQIVELTLDITEHKKAEEELAKSVKQKEILLKEVHHRVKNNLQVISGLLAIQANAAQRGMATDIVSTLDDCRNRVKSMSLIHDKLHRTGDLADVEFHDCIEAVSTELVGTYEKTGRLKVLITGDRVKIGIDQAIPCALIINELITNSLKHAFPDKRKGVITLNITEEPEEPNGSKVTIICADDGIGVDKELDWKNTSTIGLGLVVRLVKQLNGEITLSRDGGTRVEFTFRKGEPDGS